MALPARGLPLLDQEVPFEAEALPERLEGQEAVLNRKEEAVLHKNQIDVEAGAGEHITQTIQEAVILSVQERCPVALTHNGTTVTVDAEVLIQEAYTNWNRNREEATKEG